MVAKFQCDFESKLYKIYKETKTAAGGCDPHDLLLLFSLIY